jgi:lysophospholipase L1-like esterase
MGGIGSKAIKDAWQAAHAADASILNNITIICIGANDSETEFSTTTRQNIDAIVADLAAVGNTDYVIMRPGKSTIWKNGKLAAYNTMIDNLSSVYGAKYFDYVDYLGNNHDGSAQDLADVANDQTPSSFRKDTIHLNRKALDLITREIHRISTF